MARLTYCLCLLALAVLATALTTPHISHHIHKHRSSTHGRSLGKRCALPPSSSLAASSPTPSAASSAVTPAASPPPPVNVGANPTTAPSSPPHTYPSTTQEPSTSSTPTPTPTPTPSSASSSVLSTSGPSFLYGTQSGQGTYYEAGLGACGITNTDTQYIAAVSYLLFDTYPGYDGVNPNNNPVCNKKVTASYQGKSVQVTITDRCTGCAITDLDFSPAAFDSLANPGVGRIDLTWNWS